MNLISTIYVIASLLSLIKNNMKINSLLLLALSLIMLQSCSNDDTLEPDAEPIAEEPTIEEPVEEPTNSAPGAFGLISLENEATAAQRKPTLTWQASTDIDNDAVSYDVFLDTQQIPDTRIAENLTTTEFTLLEDLDSESIYYWRVVAKDDKNTETESTEIFSFTTIGITLATNAAIETAAFSSRNEHTAVEFNDKLWLIGGSNESSNLSDVWSSEDGENWTLEAENVFGSIPKNGHTSVVFDDKLWVISGFFSDVWSSTNGTDWVNATFDATFETREGHASVVFDDKMWVIGGRNSNFQTLNDVWSSTDGAVWTLESDSTQFSPRADHTVTVFNDMMYLVGGTASDTFTPGFSNDVYSSLDGINWTEVTTNPVIFETRAAHSSVVFDNKIWIIGGYQLITNDITTEQEITSFNDIWYSVDGSTWQELAPNDNFTGRFQHATTVFQNKIFITAGFKLGPNPNDREYLSDIWVLE